MEGRRDGSGQAMNEVTERGRRERGKRGVRVSEGITQHEMSSGLD